MAARGSIAKAKVAEKLRETFGDSWIGEVDKKYYIWEDDGGQNVQIAFTLTCPKVEVEAPGETKESSTAPVEAAVEDNTPLEMTPEEEQTIQTLLERLGL